MAKGNLFLGLGRGSVGDVTFYRKNGEQISRVHTKTVRNPNTDPQLIQRAILATIAKAYAAGSAIFDPSFEGVPVGADCQNLFMSRNLELLRAYVKSDIDNNRGVGQCSASVVARKGPYPVPNAYLVSQGSLIQDFMSVTAEGHKNMGFSCAAADSQTQTLAEYCAAHGLIDDDIFTVVAFAINDPAYESVAIYDSVSYACAFGYLRFRVKTTALSSTVLAKEATFGDLFEIEGTGNMAIASSMVSDETIDIAEIVRDAATGSIGIIRSRENSALRSTSYMVTPGVVYWGYSSKFLVEKWNPQIDELGQSNLILEGGNINLGR